MAIDLSSYMAAMLNGNTPEARATHALYGNFVKQSEAKLEDDQLDRVVRITAELGKINDLPKKKRNKKAIQALNNLLDKASA